MAKLGEWSKNKPATDEIQGICSVLRSYVENITKKTYREFRAYEYREQILDGKNYLIRVYVGEEALIDLMVYEPLPQKTPGELWLIEFDLRGIEQNQKPNDPLEPFKGFN
ncbi:cystatin-A-like [Fundulus heteroclitus]|uniref:cystatin-A-like n=1 Tax=Fundulus heteroclitus TaxID=8078 RepID=UPI00165A5DA8|nr:cystatin-A-like [Fundulus heteroclitus]